jgi:hypothetical protein
VLQAHSRRSYILLKLTLRLFSGTKAINGRLRDDGVSDDDDVTSWSTLFQI